jgi:G3E family GTPase
LVEDEAVEALMHRLKHMNPRAPQQRVHFGEVPIAKVFDLKGFNLNAKLDIDPEFLNEAHAHGKGHADHGHDDHGHQHGHDHGHVHDEHCDHPHHHAHDDDVKSFVFRADKPLSAAKLEDFLGAIVQVYGPKMLRYKGVLHIKGSDRKVIFQGVHQLMGSDLGPKWAPGEQKLSKMVFIGIDLPRDVLLSGLEGCIA